MKSGTLLTRFPALKFLWMGLWTLAISLKSEETAPPTPVPVPPAPLDLQTSYELAILQNETLGVKEEDIRIAQAKYWQAIGSVLPKIHVLGNESLQSSTRPSDSTLTSTGGTNLGGIDTSGGTAAGRKDRFTSRLNVKQPIFAGFRDFYVSAAAHSSVESKKNLRQRALQLLYLDVADVFYQILSCEKDLAILQEILDSLQQRIQELETRCKLGKSRLGELLMAQSDQDATLADIETTQGLLTASKELFAFFTAVPAASVRLKDTTSLPQAEQIETYLVKVEERPDIISGTEDRKSAEKLLSAAKAEHWPVISAEANYYLFQNPSTSQDWNLFLTMDIPLFEGGAIEARVNERKALLQQSELNLAQLKRTATKEVRTAYNNFIASVAEWVRLDRASQTAEKNYRVQLEDDQLGLVTHLDVLEALRRWNDVRRRTVDSETQARLNLIRLHVASGTVLPSH